MKLHPQSIRLAPIGIWQGQTHPGGCVLLNVWLCVIRVDTYSQVSCYHRMTAEIRDLGVWQRKMHLCKLQVHCDFFWNLLTFI